NPLQIIDIVAASRQRLRIAQRPEGAGAQLLLLAILARAGVAADAMAKQGPLCPTGPDLAQAVRSGRADCGIASRSVARAARLDFVPLLWERFDLVLHQRDYFLPPMQMLFEFLRSEAFQREAAELSGYDISDSGKVRLVN